MIDFNTYLERAYDVLQFLLIFSLAAMFVYGVFSSKIVNFIQSIHSANSPQTSWTRWMCSLIIISGLVICFMQIMRTGTAQEVLVFTLIGSGLAGKVTQYSIEKKKKDGSVK